MLTRIRQPNIDGVEQRKEKEDECKDKSASEILPKDLVDEVKAKEKDQKKKPNSSVQVGLNDVLYSREFLSVACLNFTIGTCFGSGVTLPGLLLKRRWSMTELQVSFFYLGSVTVLILLNVLAYKKTLEITGPWLLAEIVTFADSFIWLIAPLCLFFSWPSAVFMIGGMMTVACNSFILPTCSLLASTYCDAKKGRNIQGTVLGLTRAAFNIGQAIAPVLSMALYNVEDTDGHWLPFSLCSVLLFLNFVNFGILGGERIEMGMFTD